MEDAKWYQSWTGKVGPQILKFKVQKSFTYKLGSDAGHPFYFVASEGLKPFNLNIKSVKIMKATVKWLSQNVIIGERSFLFCFGETKCMSGKITEFRKTDSGNRFELSVVFIEPEYFEKELIESADFTINEASKILAIGKVKK